VSSSNTSLIPLFEYVADSGRFSEKIARTYFRILIETIEYCHEQGFTHRDLKPENLLFDSDFNLKVADFGFATLLAGDFGFATLLAGKDGTGQLHTILGTESYMAPEIHLRQPYSGPAVDLFASAIILFIMFSGNPPFAKADPRNDPHYKLLCINRHETFWKAHSRNKDAGFYSDDFKNLMNSMLALDPAVRLSLAEVKEHAWYNGDLVDIDELKNEFAQRKQMVDDELERQRQAKQKQKLMAQMQQGNQYGSNAFTGVKPMRSLEADMDEALKKDLESKIDFSAKREMKEHNGKFKPTSEMYTVIGSEFLFKLLCAAARSNLNEFEVSPDQFKIKGKHIKDEGTCNLNIEITKVDDTTSCIEFHKKSGNVMIFYDIIKEFKKALPDLKTDDESKDQKAEN